MNFSRTQASVPCLSEQGSTVSNVSRKARALRRRIQVQGDCPEFPVCKEGRGAECAVIGFASHRRSLHETGCTFRPCPSIGGAHSSPEESQGVPQAAALCSCFSNAVVTHIKVIDRTLFGAGTLQRSVPIIGFRPWNQIPLRPSREISHERFICDRRPLGGDKPRTGGGADAHVSQMGHSRYVVKPTPQDGPLW